MKKIGVITGTRAEYGLFKPLLEKIQKDGALELQLIVTGMHLSPEFGLTYREIIADGFDIAARNEMLLSSESAVGVTKSAGLGIIGFADIFQRLQPDIVLVLGDRFESLAAAVAAMIGRIPIAHIHGGELTEGLIDEPIRHSITKMSTIHFASTQEYRKRIIQLGEQPENVYNVGALGVENIKRIRLYTRDELADKFGTVFQGKFCMVTFHPVTLEDNTAGEQFEDLLEVLDERGDMNYVFTYANADPNGTAINQKIERFARTHANAAAFASMGQMGYLSALKHAHMVIGNSSSGLIEAPSFGIPTVDIGDRQKGRVAAGTVIHCNAVREDMKAAILRAESEQFRSECKHAVNPYEKSGTSDIIMEIIKEKLRDGLDIKKKFYDVEFEI